VEGLLTWPGKIKPLPKAVVQRLLELLPRAGVGLDAAGVLARYAATGALEALQAYALDGQDAAIRRAAIRAVLALGGGDTLIDETLRLITGPAPTRAEKSRSNLTYPATLEPMRLAYRFFLPCADEGQRQAIVQVLEHADLGGLAEEDLLLLRHAFDEPGMIGNELAGTLRARIEACNPPEAGDAAGDGAAQQPGG
jgi:hypothetical protein